MKQAIGIDIGGTSIKGALVDENGKIVESVIVDTSSVKELMLKSLFYVISKLLECEDVELIGVGSAGSIDIVKGEVTEISGNIKDWAYTPLRAILEKEFPGKRIYIDNDANVALLAERWLGVARDSHNFAMITIGTGLGGSIYLEGLGLYRGSNFKGAEFGHTVLYPKGRRCQCGLRGCAEKYISGTAIKLNYLELCGKDLNSQEILRIYDNDNNARKAINTFIEDLVTFTITLKNFLDVEMLIIGGGVINSRNIWWDKYVQSVYKKFNSVDNFKIVPAKFSNNAGVIGAARLAFDNED